MKVYVDRKKKNLVLSSPQDMDKNLFQNEWTQSDIYKCIAGRWKSSSIWSTADSLVLFLYSRREEEEKERKKEKNKNNSNDKILVLLLRLQT